MNLQLVQLCGRVDIFWSGKSEQEIHFLASEKKCSLIATILLKCSLLTNKIVNAAPHFFMPIVG